ncbi:MAG: LysR family transcriptional regulator [Devosia sp.]
MLDWDDLRFVLALARSGAALAAACQLGVNQTTVTRRLAGLEAALGANLFERSPQGHRLTELGQRVARTAEAMEAQVLHLTSEVAAGQRVVTGIVRFICPETIANHLLAPWLGDFRGRYPDVLIEVINSDAMLDLGKGEADVAMRVGAPPSGAGIVARRLPDCPWTAYSSRAYVRERGSPAAPTELAAHALIGLDGAQAGLPSAIWFRQVVGAERIRVRCNSLSNVVHSLRAGLGIGMLPCVIGDAEPELVRCFPPVPELDAQTWLIVRQVVKTATHVRAFVDFLGERLTKELQACHRTAGPAMGATAARYGRGHGRRPPVARQSG